MDNDEDEDPLGGVANLFDVAMVFAVALLVALVASYNVPEMLDSSSDLTVVKNPGQPNMQVIIKEGQTIKVLNMTEEISGGQGSRWGLPIGCRAARSSMSLIRRRREERIYGHSPAGIPDGDDPSPCPHRQPERAASGTTHPGAAPWLPGRSGSAPDQPLPDHGQGSRHPGDVGSLPGQHHRCRHPHQTRSLRGR
jgi:hypothetical protein